MASRKVLRAEAFVVVVLVKSTDLPVVGLGEGELEHSAWLPSLLGPAAPWLPLEPVGGLRERDSG